MKDSITAQQEDPDRHFAPPSPPSDTDYRHARWPRRTPLPARYSSPRESRDVRDELPGRASAAAADPRLIAIVGVCSSGKSTLARALRDRGFRVRTVAQEHSYIPYLWRLCKPDVLVYLDALLPTIRRRRRARWQQPVLDEEHRRLAHAREHCDLYVHTDGLSPNDVASRVLTFMNNSKESVPG